jgi:hypothetical protein
VLGCVAVPVLGCVAVPVLGCVAVPVLGCVLVHAAIHAAIHATIHATIHAAIMATVAATVTATVTATTIAATTTVTATATTTTTASSEGGRSHCGKQQGDTHQYTKCLLHRYSPFLWVAWLLFVYLCVTMSEVKGLQKSTGSGNNLLNARVRYAPN